MRTLVSYSDYYSRSESFDVIREFARSHAEQAGFMAPQLLAWIHNSNVKALMGYEFDYGDARWDAASLYHARQAIAFFTKNDDIPLGLSPSQAAFDTFMAAEEACASTNEVISAVMAGNACFLDRKLAGWILRAKALIRNALGELPPLEELELSFGPGATRSVKRSLATARSKLAEQLQCSEELSPVVGKLLAEMPSLLELHASQTTDECDQDEESSEFGFADDGRPYVSEDDRELDTQYEKWKHDYDCDYEAEAAEMRLLAQRAYSVEVITQTSKLGFVPKNAKTDRTICVEPGLNVIYQGALGRALAERLRSIGIDIRDQSRNQRMAYVGSITGALATLDQKSASDMMAHVVIQMLLPLDWALALSHGRTGLVELPDGLGHLHQAKFSSMGNGFTFPLQTLIFWAVTQAVIEDVNGTRSHKCRDDISVYGDDVVCPSGEARIVIRALQGLGFTVNAGKSYIDGPFRESCGKDFYSGTDVRPYFQRGRVSARSLFSLHNFYKRRGDRSRALRVLSRLASTMMLFGPDGFGDGVLISENFSKTLSNSAIIAGYGGYFFKCYQDVGSFSDEECDADAALPAYTSSLGGMARPEEVDGPYRFLLPEERPAHRFNADGVLILAKPEKAKLGSPFKKVKVYNWG